MEWLLDVLRAVWRHWMSPEFRPLLWAVPAYVIGAAQGYAACLDAEEAARADADRAGRGAWGRTVPLVRVRQISDADWRDRAVRAAAGGGDDRAEADQARGGASAEGGAP